MARQYYKVRRGMVFWYDNTLDNKVKTSVQQGSRPYVVVSCDEGNLTAPTCNVAPCTTENKTYIPTHIDCWFNGQKNTILLEQIITVDQNSIGDFICMLTDETLEKIEKALTIQYSIRPQVKYADFRLNNVVTKLENIVEEIIKNKVKQYQSVIPQSDIEESALKLGQLIEDLVGVNHTERNQIETPVANIDAVKSHPDLETVSSSVTEHKDIETVKPYVPEVDVKKTKEIKKEVKKPMKQNDRIKWTDDMRRQFLDDCDKMSPEEVRVKYGFGPISSVFQTKYMCKNILGIK